MGCHWRQWIYKGHPGSKVYRFSLQPLMQEKTDYTAGFSVLQFWFEHESSGTEPQEHLGDSFSLVSVATLTARSDHLKTAMRKHELCKSVRRWWKVLTSQEK